MNLDKRAKTYNPSNAMRNGVHLPYCLTSSLFVERYRTLVAGDWEEPNPGKGKEIMECCLILDFLVV